MSQIIWQMMIVIEQLDHLGLEGNREAGQWKETEAWFKYYCIL